MKAAFLRGSSWTIGGQIVVVALGILSILVLARLLEPEDFGLIGLLGSVIAVLGLFREIGLTTAIVQKANIRESELTRILMLTVVLGFVVGGLATAAGYGVSYFVDEPRIKEIAPWFGLCFLLNSLETVPLGLMRRALKFRQLVVRDIISKAAGIGICILAAWAEWGYWALVVQALTMASINLGLTWSAAKWRPIAAAAPWREIVSYLKFGASFTSSNVAAYLTQNFDSLLIGKYSGLTALGYYGRARTLMLTPLSQAMGPLGTVLIPVMSRVKDEPARMRVWVDKLSRAFLYFSAPVAAILMAGSSEIIEIFLGDKWMEVVPIFWWLSISVASSPLGSLFYWVLVTSGRGELLFYWTIAGAVITCLAVALAISWGVVAVAASIGLTSLIARSFIAIYFASQTGFFNLRSMVSRYVGGILLGCCWLGTLTYVMKVANYWLESPLIRLGVLCATATALFTAFTVCTPLGRCVWKECRDLFRSLRPARSC